MDAIDTLRQFFTTGPIFGPLGDLSPVFLTLFGLGLAIMIIFGVFNLIRAGLMFASAGDNAGKEDRARRFAKNGTISILLGLGGGAIILLLINLVGVVADSLTGATNTGTQPAGNIVLLFGLERLRRLGAVRLFERS